MALAQSSRAHAPHSSVVRRCPLGGGTVVGTLPVAAAFTAYGVLRRDEARGRLLVVTFGVTVVGLAGWLAL